MLDKNPERFGTTREHVSKVNRDLGRLEEKDNKERQKREIKAQKTIEEI